MFQMVRLVFNCSDWCVLKPNLNLKFVFSALRRLDVRATVPVLDPEVRRKNAAIVRCCLVFLNWSNWSDDKANLAINVWAKFGQGC